MLKYEQIALEKKLDEQSPTKERIMWDRLFNLYQATLEDVFATATVDPNEIVNYYGKNKDSFKQVKVKAIYIPFADAPAAEDKSLTEAQAKAKADKLVAQAKSGADFVKLVKENSEDDPSKAKDGDFGTLRRHRSPAGCHSQGGVRARDGRGHGRCAAASRLLRFQG